MFTNKRYTICTINKSYFMCFIFFLITTNQININISRV